MIRSRDGGTAAALREVQYDAYEANANLLGGCRERLRNLGFKEEEEKGRSGDRGDNGAAATFRLKWCGDRSGAQSSPLDVSVRLHARDFRGEGAPQGAPAPDLVVGCCFADLFNPHDLTRSLLRFTGWGLRGTTTTTPRGPPLLYFPITFAGTTRFDPPRPFDVAPGGTSESGGADGDPRGSGRPIPSDTTAFRLYSRALEGRHGHNLDPGLIASALKDHGGSVVAEGRSDWVIDPPGSPVPLGDHAVLLRDDGLS